MWRGASGALGSAPRWCPHLDWDLTEGTVVDDELVCTGHGWSFDCEGHAFKRTEARPDRPQGRHRDGAARRGATATIARLGASFRSFMTTYPPDGTCCATCGCRSTTRREGSRAWLPVVPGVCGDDGAVRAGALATLVDVIGGGLAATHCATELDRDRRPHAAPHGRRDRRRGRSARAASCARAARRSCSRSRCTRRDDVRSASRR